MKPTVPDTITSWVITAFSVDSLYGLGLLDAPKKVKLLLNEFKITAIRIRIFSIKRNYVTYVENKLNYNFFFYIKETTLLNMY